MKLSLILTLVLILSLGLSACALNSPAIVDLTGSTQAASLPAVHSSPSPITVTEEPAAASAPTAGPASSPAPSPTPESLGCLKAGGRLEHGSLPYGPPTKPLDYTVYLPPCYDQQRNLRYPVLYLIHGQSYNDDQWDRLGMDETANRLIASGKISPLIIVMPRDWLWSQPTEDPFGKYIVEDLIPFIDRQYRTRTDRAYRAIGGLSRGAGWAVHLGLSNWELFGAIGAHSLPIFWTDTYHLREWLDAIPEESLPRIYIDVGDKDRQPILQSAKWFEKLLTEKNIPHEWHLYTGYHEEAYWQAHINDYLRWYVQDWQVER